MSGLAGLTTIADREAAAHKRRDEAQAILDSLPAFPVGSTYALAPAQAARIKAFLALVEHGTDFPPDVLDIASSDGPAYASFARGLTRDLAELWLAVHVADEMPADEAGWELWLAYQIVLLGRT